MPLSKRSASHKRELRKAKAKPPTPKSAPPQAATVTTATNLPVPAFPAPLASAEASAMNLLLGVFPVPPFLLPIYQAAAVDFGVPWEVLAAINEVETDYGRNLSTSSAGAVGWMQFLPSSWARFGIDADARGSANPYDPIDAIFAAARYLHAAGAESNLPAAIFAYNHADWYVSSVELRARLLQYLPQAPVDGLTGLMQAIFPIAGHLRRYAMDPTRATRIAGQPALLFSAPAGAPVIATADARVVALGRNPQRGRYITLEDSYGDRFTYSGLGRTASLYPLLKPRVESALKLARELRPGVAVGHVGALPAATRLPGSAATPVSGVSTPARLPTATGPAPGRSQPEPPTPAMPKERLFADPARPASYAAGGRLQLESTLMAYAAAANGQVGGRGPSDYFSESVRMRLGEFTLAPLTRGSVVAAGTILGRVGRRHGVAGIVFQIRPAGAKFPVDPAPIVAGWELIGRLTAGRAALVGAGVSGAFGVDNPSLGQLLLGTKKQLERAVLADRRVTIDACDRRGIRAGKADRRVLAMLEYLSYSGLGPAAWGFACGPSDGLNPHVYISELNRIPVAGHQQNGGIVDLAIRRILGLRGALRPSAIVSQRDYVLQPEATAASDHADRFEVDFSPTVPGLASPLGGRLDTGQWTRLIARLRRLTVAQP